MHRGILLSWQPPTSPSCNSLLVSDYNTYERLHWLDWQLQVNCYSVIQAGLCVPGLQQQQQQRFQAIKPVVMHSQPWIKMQVLTLKCAKVSKHTLILPQSPVLSAHLLKFPVTSLEPTQQRLMQFQENVENSEAAFLDFLLDCPLICLDWSFEAAVYSHEGPGCCGWRGQSACTEELQEGNTGVCVRVT